MSTLRPLNQCNDCGDTWYPRGSDLSDRCPTCRSENTGFAPFYRTASSGCGCLGCGTIVKLFLLGVVVLVVASWLSDRTSNNSNVKNKDNDAEVVREMEQELEQLRKQEEIRNENELKEKMEQAKLEQEKKRLEERKKELEIEKLKVELNGFRTWQSADKKFKVRAKFHSMDYESVTLVRADSGNKITVPLRKLSIADRVFLTSHESAVDTK